MKKFIFGILLGAAMTIGIIPAAADELSSEVNLTADENGGAAVSIRLDDSEGVTSMRLRLHVTQVLGDDKNTEPTFEFNPQLPSRVARYRYDSEKDTLTLYISGREELFESGIAELGTVKLTSSGESSATASVSVKEDCLRVLNASYGGEWNPEPQLPYDPVEITVGNGGITGELTVDKTQLQKLLEEALEKREKDYTAESWRSLQLVIRYCERILGSLDVTQEEIDAALEKLNQALEQLIPASSSSGEASTVTPAGPSENAGGTASTAGDNPSYSENISFNSSPETSNAAAETAVPADPNGVDFSSSSETMDIPAPLSSDKADESTGTETDGISAAALQSDQQEGAQAEASDNGTEGSQKSGFHLTTKGIPLVVYVAFGVVILLGVSGVTAYLIHRRN